MGNAAERLETRTESEHIVVATDNYGFSAIAYSTSRPQVVVSASSAEEAFYTFMKQRSPESDLQAPTQLLASAVRGDLGLTIELQNIADIR